jgi:hypothetical protein
MDFDKVIFNEVIIFPITLRIIVYCSTFVFLRQMQQNSSDIWETIDYFYFKELEVHQIQILNITETIQKMKNRWVCLFLFQLFKPNSNLPISEGKTRLMLRF